MNEIFGPEMDQKAMDTYISSCISRYKQAIYDSKEISQQIGEDMLRGIEDPVGKYQDIHKQEDRLTSKMVNIQPDDYFSKSEFSTLQYFASSHLKKAEPYLSKKLVSSKNFSDIQLISQIFPSFLTSFLGFECHLGDKKPRADWAFAISGVGPDRQVFTQLLSDGNFPEVLLKTPEWRRISNFAKEWADNNSNLNDKIQCFWLEFDMPDEQNGVPIPSVFFGPTKKHTYSKGKNISDFKWLTETAIPLLKGQEVPKEVKQKINESLSKMPEETSLFQIGTMLSRENQMVRLHINKIKPEQIIPYLKQIGYEEKDDGLEILIDEIKDKADRFVLSFDVKENGIGPRIGIELSYSSDLFQEEKRWDNLLDYLVEKGICLEEKREALLNYTGAEENHDFSGAVLKPVSTSADYLDKINKSTMVRYINHVKIVYNPNKKLEAKAYPAVRLFENKQ